MKGSANSLVLLAVCYGNLAQRPSALRSHTKYRGYFIKYFGGRNCSLHELCHLNFTTSLRNWCYILAPFHGGGGGTALERQKILVKHYAVS